MRTCPHCGMENKSSANFCGRCGTQLPAETPVEIQPSENKMHDAQSSTRAAGKKKKFWKIAAIPALVLVVGVLLFKGIRQSHSCPTCNEILSLQKELQAVLAENEDNSLTFAAFERWNIEVATLSNEIQLLKDHECSMPVRKVKEQEYSYGRYLGSYTGDWKSTAPYGEGVFSGSYRTGDTVYVFTYSGEWSAGAPNGTGTMLEHWEYLGAGSTANWNSWLYEGTFIDGTLTGSGWSSMENSSGERVEYFDGVYRNGFLEGQANFLQYKDGELYDKGIVEGIHYIPIYSERQEIQNVLQTAGVLLLVDLGAKYLFDVIDITLNGTASKSFQNSSAGKWLAAESASISADMEMWLRNKEYAESKEQLYDTWQALESRVKWCETSPYDYVREEVDYFRAQANEAQKAYNAY